MIDDPENQGPVDIYVIKRTDFGIWIPIVAIAFLVMILIFPYLVKKTENSEGSIFTLMKIVTQQGGQGQCK